MKPRRSPKSRNITAKRTARKIIVEFPPALYAETKKATAGRAINRSTLIRTAVQEYLDKLRREELEKQLAEGYLANARQAGETAETFSYVDSELG